MELIKYVCNGQSHYRIYKDDYGFILILTKIDGTIENERRLAFMSVKSAQRLGKDFLDGKLEVAA